MGIALAGILKAAATSVLGDKLKKVAVEKVTSVAREKLGLPKNAPEKKIEEALGNDPQAYAEIVAEMTQWRIEQERTAQVAMEQQGESERVALQSESRFVKYARPAALYGAVASCLLLIVSGLIVISVAAYTGEAQLFNYYVEFVKAASMPITGLMAIGGIYTHRRTTDKAIGAGLPLPSIFGGAK